MAGNPHEPQLNPYAPPLSSLTQEVPQRPLYPDVPLDLASLQLLDGLANEPIKVQGQVEEFVYSGTVRFGHQPFLLKFRVHIVMCFVCIMAFYWSTSPIRRVSPLVIWLTVMAIYGIALRFRRRIPPRYRLVEMKSPAGVYVWLISEGGVLISTPAGAQWAAPWGLLDHISCDGKFWHCHFKSSHDPQWRMPVAAFGGADISRFQALVEALPSLGHSHRPHPVSHAVQVPWTDHMKLDSGLNWSVLHEGSAVWCDVRGLVCSLPQATISRTTKALTIRDPETNWTAEFPFNAEAV